MSVNVEVKPTVHDYCHPETCACGDYTLWVDGHAKTTGDKAWLDQVADALVALETPL